MAAKSDGPVQVRWKVNIDGLVLCIASPRRGDVIEVPDIATALRYYAAGLLNRCPRIS